MLCGSYFWSSRRQGRTGNMREACIQWQVNTSNIGIWVKFWYQTGARLLDLGTSG